ncbi:XylR N-terminal domain-containing protein [Neobacillus drentensis]|uniref:helix-turn-helix domain-containing protein n=1 Tax=Neobacillus drentensis TaxID=220684 RepID=UPI003000B154
MKVEDLNLGQFYKSFTQLGQEDSIYERIISSPSSARAALKHELFETIGMERTKGVLLRYGWHCGVSDAKKMKEVDWDYSKELMLAGPKMHVLHGYLEDVIMPIKEVDFEKGTLHLDAIWVNTFEAIEHLKLFGLSETPVCDTMVGYASGYLSTILGEQVIVKEVECKAMGYENCRCICRTVKEWNGEVDEELTYYQSNSLINELDQTYEKLKIERDNLNKAYHVHERLMNEVLQENGLSSIVEILYETIGLPVLIEDQEHNLISFAGMPGKDAGLKKQNPSKNVNKTVFKQFDDGTKKLITPIFLQQKIKGYCSFLYEGSMPTELDKMILERAALACSTILLNERTRLNTEQRIRRSFLEDILSCRLTKQEMAKLAYHLGFKHNPSIFILNLKRSVQTMSFENELEFNEELINQLFMYFKDRNINALLAQKSEEIIILLSEGSLKENSVQMHQMVKNLLDYCIIKFPKSSFAIGISSTSSSMENAAQLYNESLAALYVTNKSRNIVYFDSLGIEGILFQVKNEEMIQKFINKQIGTLIEKDKNMELTKTLYHYLNNGCNVHKTARNMNFSINGLRYRLQRLKEILQTDINRPNVSFQLFFVLQSLIIRGELDIEIEIESDLDIDTDFVNK